MKSTIIALSSLLICLIGHAQTRLWGTTYGGGTTIAGQTFGTLFSTDNNGNAHIVHKSFDLGIKAKNPEYSNLIEATNGKLYGMTCIGGAKALGVIFEYNPSNNLYVNKIDFDSINGSNPYGSLMQASNGKLYGMTRKGGTNNLGVLFEFDPITNTFTKKNDFSGTTNGSEPYGGLIQATNGKLYGMTSLGGTNSKGVLFEFDPTTNIYIKKINFNGTANGNFPSGDLMQATNGKLYGMTSAGGSVNGGILFEYNITSNVLTKLYDFTYSTACHPKGSIIQASNGNLYGLLTDGGSVNLGTIFQYNLSSGFTIKHTFPSSGNIYSPTGNIIEGTNGKLYGMAQGGLNTNGVIFDFDLNSNSFNKDIDFNGLNGHYPQASLMLASNGKMYGMTKNGGTGNRGNLFEYDPNNNTVISKLDFYDFECGIYPLGGLVKTSNDKLYGTTSEYGSLFEYNQITDTLIWKIKFNGSVNGLKSKGSLIEASNYKLYGTASEGGANNFGVFFEYDPIMDVFNKIIDFGPGKGYYPSGSLFQASNGNLYGLAKNTSTTNYVVIYEYDISLNAFSLKYSGLNNLQGATPTNSLVEATNGKLYGLTNGGGTNGKGVIFEYSISNNSYVKKVDFDGVLKGANPGGALMLANNGKLYGLTVNGGTSSKGVLFEYDPITNIYVKKIDFNSINGDYPVGTLMQALNGKIYGITNSGGANNFGVLFEFDPVTGILVNKLDFNNNDGSYSNWVSSLIEATGPALDDASFGYSLSAYCQSSTDPTPTITGLAGGTFTSSPAGLIINSSTGTISLAMSTANTYAVTYHTTGSFPNTSTVNITITSPPNATFNYSGPYCSNSANPFPTLSGGSSAGTFSSTTGMVFVSTSTGQIDLPATTPGSYMVTNTVAAAGGCSSVMANSSIIINPLPVLSLFPTSQNFCTGSLVSDSMTSNLPGTTYSWTVTQSGVTGASSGTGTNISQILTTTGTATGTAIYTITPLANSCTGLSQQFTATIDTAISLTVNSSSICLGQIANLTAHGALSYAWSGGATVTGANTANVSPNVTSAFTVTGTSGSCTDSAIAMVAVDSCFVWPGDANNDSVVNNYDLLPIGLYHSQIGSSRANTSNLWQAESSNNWGPIQSNGSDIKHVDCNGDGLIDNNDTLAIHLNFNLAHAYSPNNNYYNEMRQTTPDMYFVINNSSYNAGDLVDVEIWLGTSAIPVYNLYGIAFNINYLSSLVQSGTENLIFPSSWLGTPATNAINISKIDPIVNTVYGAETRIDHNNAYGFGKIANFKFQLKNTISPNSIMIFSFSSYVANDSVGALLLFSTKTDSIIINPITTGVQETNKYEEISIYPNPFTLQTTISFNREIKNATIKVVDVIGQEVKNIKFSGTEIIIQKGELKAGIYFVQVVSSGGLLANRKVVVQ